MKTTKLFFNLKNQVFAALVCTIFLAASCKKETQPTVNCAHKGSFVYKQGLNSFYGSYYIVSENNETIVPCDAVPNLIDAKNIYDGMPVTFDYKTINEETSCGNCREISSYPSSPRFVKITCIGKNKPHTGDCGTKE